MVHRSTNISDDNQIKEYVRLYIDETFKSINMLGFDIPVTLVGRKEFTNSKYTEQIRKRYHDIFIDKMRMSNNLDEIINATEGYKYEGPKHPRKDNIIGFVRGKIQVSVGLNDYVADIVLADKENAGIMIYDIVEIHPTKIEAVTIPIPKNSDISRQVTALSGNVTQNTTNINSKKSLDSDTRYSLEPVEPVNLECPTKMVYRSI